MRRLSYPDNYVLLASQSPRRQQLLRQIDINYSLLLPQPDEQIEQLEQLVAGESLSDYVQRVVRLKLQAAQDRRIKWLAQGVNNIKYLAHAPILCADTSVGLDNMILGKPKDIVDAKRMLKLLSGKTHQVATAIGLISATNQLQNLVVSTVEFAHLTEQQIDAYIASGQAFDKAGAYAIQGIAAKFVKSINGSYSGIIGLPLYQTVKLLQQFNM